MSGVRWWSSCCISCPVKKQTRWSLRSTRPVMAWYRTTSFTDSSRCVSADPPLSSQPSPPVVAGSGNDAPQPCTATRPHLQVEHSPSKSPHHPMYRLPLQTLTRCEPHGAVHPSGARTHRDQVTTLPSPSISSCSLSLRGMRRGVRPGRMGQQPLEYMITATSSPCSQRGTNCNSPQDPTLKVQLACCHGTTHSLSGIDPSRHVSDSKPTQPVFFGRRAAPR